MLELENLNVESPELTSPSPGRIKGFFCALLRPRRFPLLVAALGVALTLPSLSAGLAFDDYHAKLCLQGSDSPVRLMDSPLDLFRFCKGPQHLARIMDFGFFPWWTCGNIKAAFWRPLASLTHWVDYTLWPETPALMHLHSILWYAGAVAVVALLYRRLMGATVAAGLAAVLYAVDDAHGMVVGFLSNRSDLPAVVFGVLCLIAHDRWRRRRWRLGAGLGPVLLLVSLLFKEAAIATCAYLAAYELFLRHGRRPGRLWALAPYAVVVLAWRLCWSGLGYGLAEIAPYVDPVTEPWRFAFAVLERHRRCSWASGLCPPRR